MTRRIVTLALVALAVGAAAAQRADAPQQPFRSRTNYVRVDVYPTRGGVPVLGLRADEFEVLEDDVPQSIQAFEHVVVRSAGPQSMRPDPNSLDAQTQAAADAHSRVFVLFLDVPHVTPEGAHHVREALIRLVDRILGPDDLIGIMTPGMAASDLVLGRKTQVLESGLRSGGLWGERFTIDRSPREMQYQACYPEPWQGNVVEQMIDRARERLTLDSLNELVRHLRNIREGRTAILTVSEGWLLFREDKSLTNLRQNEEGTVREPAPAPDPLRVGPDGKITARNRNNLTSATKSDCDADRMRLAMIDDDRYFRDIVDEANRANASFYTIDPRGLPVFDTPVGPAGRGAPVRVTTDLAMLNRRQDNLRVLAENTDGLSVMNNNDVETGLRRIAEDLTSYYLLGYYSSNLKLDGKYRAIKVRVNRTGVAVRARKGYRAATEAEVNRATAAAAAPVLDVASTIASALASLDRARPGVRFYVHAVPAAAAATLVSTVWVAGEFGSSGTVDPWTTGGTAEIDVSGPGTSGTARAVIAAGDRGFVVPVALDTPIKSGSLDVRVRLVGAGGLSDPATGGVSVDVVAGIGRPLLFRRGPTTGNRLQPVATFQYSRSERAHLEAPLAADAKPLSARLIERTGKTIGVPVTLGERSERDQRWLTADATLAPLAPGDYAIEVITATPTGEHRTITGIRVTR